MRYLAAMRAMLGLDQSTVASECGLSALTVLKAEQGQASDKTRAALLAFYAQNGIQLAPLPGGNVALTWWSFDDYDMAATWIAPQSIATAEKRRKKSRVLPPKSVST